MACAANLGFAPWCASNRGGGVPRSEDAFGSDCSATTDCGEEQLRRADLEGTTGKQLSFSDRGHPKDVAMAETTTDHDAIREWAEDKGGKPAAVKRTHNDDDVGIIRIMFPDAPNSEHDALVEVSWEEFFEEFEERELALLFEKDSMFSKIVGRDTVEKRARGDHDG
jgi:hypothetical protein